jgi:hypothetical protein
MKRTNMSQLASEFTLHDERFHELTGPSPSLELLLQHDEYPFAHEAGVYIPSTNEIFITSNQFFNSSGQRCVQISKIAVGDGSKKAIREEIPSDEVPMANGGINYKDGIFSFPRSTDEPLTHSMMSSSTATGVSGSRIRFMGMSKAFALNLNCRIRCIGMIP